MNERNRWEFCVEREAGKYNVRARRHYADGSIEARTMRTYDGRAEAEFDCKRRPDTVCCRCAGYGYAASSNGPYTDTCDWCSGRGLITIPADEVVKR